MSHQLTPRCCRRQCPCLRISPRRPQHTFQRSSDGFTTTASLEEAHKNCRNAEMMLHDLVIAAAGLYATVNIHTIINLVFQSVHSRIATAPVRPREPIWLGSLICIHLGNIAVNPENIWRTCAEAVQCFKAVARGVPVFQKSSHQSR